MGAGAHVARLLLDPHDLAQVGVAVDELEDLRLREGIEELDPADGDLGLVLPLAGAAVSRSGWCCVSVTTPSRAWTR